MHTVALFNEFGTSKIKKRLCQRSQVLTYPREIRRCHDAKTIISKSMLAGASSIRLTETVLRHSHMPSRINLFRPQQARNSSSNAQAGPKKPISPHVSHSSYVLYYIASGS